MTFFYAILLALANNLDTLGVRVAYSLKGIKVTTGINLWMACIAFVISAGASSSAMALSTLLPASFIAYLTMTLFVFMGILLIIEPYYTKNKQRQTNPSAKNILHILAHPVAADQDRSQHIDFKEATLLGLALALNNLGGGLTAGMIGVSWWLIGLLSALMSFIIFWAGNQFIRSLQNWQLGNKASWAGGMLLILIGIKQIF